jgi:hypothetical protein
VQGEGNDQKESEAAEAHEVIRSLLPIKIPQRLGDLDARPEQGGQQFVVCWLFWRAWLC